jgi:hypothetical protein
VRAISTSSTLAEEMPDLAPTIYRQCLVIEGTYRPPVGPDTIHYLQAWSDRCEIKIPLDPVTHRSDRYGWAGWVHWEASGVHVYAWKSPTLCFRVDIHAWKPFDWPGTVEFTADFFDATQIVAKAF